MWLSQWWRRHKRWPVVAGGSFQSRRGLCCSCGNRRRGLAWECGCIVGAKGKLTVVTRVVLGGWMACNGGERELNGAVFRERDELLKLRERDSWWGRWRWSCSFVWFFLFLFAKNFLESTALPLVFSRFFSFSSIFLSGRHPWWLFIGVLGLTRWLADRWRGDLQQRRGGCCWRSGGWSAVQVKAATGCSG